MYSVSSVAVDKGLGFDFSEIAGVLKAAMPVALNVYQNKMQVQQIRTMGAMAQQGGYAVPLAGGYAQPYGTLPTAQPYQMQPTFGGQPGMMPLSSGMGMGTIAMLGAGVIGLAVAAKMLLK